MLKLFNCELKDGRATSAPALRREGIAGVCEALEIEHDNDNDDYADVPTHDPHILPHQVRPEELDRFFPRATPVPPALGEADEVADPDMAEPRALLVSSSSDE